MLLLAADGFALLAGFELLVAVFVDYVILGVCGLIVLICRFFVLLGW